MVEIDPSRSIMFGLSFVTRATFHEPQYRYTVPSTSVKTWGSMTS